MVPGLGMNEPIYFSIFHGLQILILLLDSFSLFGTFSSKECTYVPFSPTTAILSESPLQVSLIWAVAASNAVVIFQWYFWGYTLAFSSTATNGFIGNLKSFGLKDVEADPSPATPLIPEILYSFFQMEFACVTAGILMGGLAERGRVLPAMVFIFCWMTLVYCPLACWIWATHGWAFKWGVLDFAGSFLLLFHFFGACSHTCIHSFAGGGPVEIGSGVAGLAYSWVIGRRNERELLNFRPHNVSLVGLGSESLQVFENCRHDIYHLSLPSLHAMVRMDRI